MRYMSRIRETLSTLQRRHKKAFIPYVMAGDASLEQTMKHVLLLEECGADIVELGVPFSDPVADGPTIQRAAERALASGVTLKKIILFVKELRQRSQIPIVLMTYYNPVFKYGEERFVDDAVAAGVDGVIIPDLPPEEARVLIRSSRRARLDTIFLVAPTSTDERVKRITAACSGFVYYVSITGITGTGISLGQAFKDHLRRVRESTRKPVAVGFGVSKPEEAGAIAQLADGVIVGSALVKKFYEHPGSARNFIQELREAIGQ